MPSGYKGEDGVSGERGEWAVSFLVGSYRVGLVKTATGTYSREGYVMEETA